MSRESPDRAAALANGEDCVVCGVNGPESRMAVLIAARLASALGARLLLVHVHPPPSRFPPGWLRSYTAYASARSRPPSD